MRAKRKYGAILAIFHVSGQDMSDFEVIIPRARSYIAIQGVLLVYTKNLSMSGRPAGRPAVVTLLRGLYLWNRKPD